jgi:ferric-dicitrate binding protein FerR (iron transport regulator)
MEVPVACSKEASWMKLQERIVVNEATNVVELSSRRRWVLTAAAAAIFLVLGAVWMFQPTKLEGSIAVIERTETRLPDGSAVVLLPGATLSYAMNDQERVVNLNGEAYFEVTKGVPFQVKTLHGEVEVLGTSFVVYAKPDAFSVECHTGKVSVRDSEVLRAIEAGQAVKMRNGSLSEPFEHGFGIATISDDERSYTNADLARVFEHVEQRFDVKVRFDNETAKLEFSGTFVMETADRALEIITKAMGLSLLKDGDDVYWVQ